MLTIDLVRHMKAKNRRKWTAPQDDRPLSKLGVRQAAFQVDAMVEGDRIDAIYSSPAVRCRTTIAPVAGRLGLEVQIEPLLAETEGYPEPAGWAGFDFGMDRQDSGNPMGPAFWAGRGLAFVDKMQSTHPKGGRIVACSHGDTIPLIVASLTGMHGIEPPPPLWGFGGWYRIRLEGDDATIVRFDPPPGFADL
jgi:broad specificity phosphatase PhoE